jgi:hypothetical protein
LPQTPYVVLDVLPVNRQPIEVIALRSVPHGDAVVPNMPIGSGVFGHRHSSQVHLTTSAPFRAGHPHPYPASYAGLLAEGPAMVRPGFLLPFGCRLLLLGHP